MMRRTGATGWPPTSNSKFCAMTCKGGQPVLRGTPTRLKGMPSTRLRKTCKRYNEPGHAHELTFSCHKRLPLLSKDRTRRWLIEAIHEARRSCKFDLWAYVIMPEHAHLLVWPREPEYDMSSILWRIKRPVGLKAIAFLEMHNPAWLKKLTSVNRKGQVERHFWLPGGGYDRNIVEPATAHSMAEYIHMNPVRRGLVQYPEEWEWSSARWYAGQRPVVLEIDATMPMNH